MDPDSHVHALNAVLRVAASHANLLEESAFAELTRVIADHVAFDRLSISLPEERPLLRIYALSHPASAPIPFGGRMQSTPEAWTEIIERFEPRLCHDTSAGIEVERIAARGGVAAYGAFPIRVPGGPVPMGPQAAPNPGPAGPAPMRAIGVLSLSFVTTGASRSLPVDLVQAIADAIGPSLARGLSLGRERRLALILETSGDAMIAWDRSGLIADANAAALSLTGRSRAELLGVPIASLLDPPPIAEGGTASEGVRLALLSYGWGGPRRIPVAATVTAVTGDALVVGHALLRDLSHVVRAEQEAAARLARIHELEQQHRTLLDNVPLIIFRLHPTSGELVYLNRHAERLLGVPTTDALRTPGFLRDAHADPHGVASFDAAVARARLGLLSLPYEACLARAQGDEIIARGTVYPLLADGGVAAIEGVLADVSGEHTARTRLVQADRLSTLGTLAAGMAHEINNPAAHILLGLDMLARSLGGPGVEMEPRIRDNTMETLGELRASIRRIVDIARDLRVFASPVSEIGNRTFIDINRTVESALSLTRGQIIERAQIERRLDDVPSVVMEDGRLGQVIVNLLVNAVQAIPKSSAAENSITVATRSDGWTVDIEITDTGVGIPREHIHRIWQPFFTTKGEHAGTGLGLSIGREIIERAGGSITVESPVAGSDPPRGARFVISLPVSGNDEPLSPRSSPSPGAALGRAQVLIVEDEAALARALAEEIGRHHDVVIANGADAALALLAEARFDVVLCDIRMPGMSGDALYAKVREKDEAQARAFVFMTGVGFGADVERLMAESGLPVLEKPFSGDTALVEIARALRKRGHH